MRCPKKKLVNNPRDFLFKPHCVALRTAWSPLPGAADLCSAQTLNTAYINIVQSPGVGYATFCTNKQFACVTNDVLLIMYPDNTKSSLVCVVSQTHETHIIICEVCVYAHYCVQNALALFRAHKIHCLWWLRTSENGETDNKPVCFSFALTTSPFRQNIDHLKSYYGIKSHHLTAKE